LDLAVPYGTMLRVPVDWTDRDAPVAPPRMDGRDVRLSTRGLAMLSESVTELLDRRQAQPHVSAQARIEPPSRPVNAIPSKQPDRPTVLERAAGERAARSGRRVGRARTPDPASRSGRGVRS